MRLSTVTDLTRAADVFHFLIETFLWNGNGDVSVLYRDE